jgi:cyclophilin family peptidyl-prolyl cis-trans isomerase
MARNFVKLTLLSALLALIFNSCKKETIIETIVDPPIPQEEIIQISTQYGDMYLWLYKATPLHRENFLKLAKDSFYNNTTFHRIISGFMIQGGDPNSKDADSTNDGTGDPGYTIPAEIRDSIKHDRGALAAARLSDAVNPLKASSGSQFYICHSKSGTQGLNNQYTVFGMVMKGLNVIDSVVKQPKNKTTNRPYSDVKMQVKVLKKTLDEIKLEYNYVPKQ